MDEKRETIEVSGKALAFDDNVIRLTGLQEWLAVEMAQIPKPFRADAYIKGWASGGYGDSSPDCEEITICYQRPETDAEMVERIDRDRRYKAEYEARERAHYETLKAKYG